MAIFYGKFHVIILFLGVASSLIFTSIQFYLSDWFWGFQALDY
jgi:hypothetical protein